MRTMIRHKDLNLLYTLVIMLEERHVSRAAKRLRLTQPAVSRAIDRLRRDFNDPMFIREGAGMVPTPYAIEVGLAAQKTLSEFEKVYQPRQVFLPEEAAGSFRIATTDFFEMTYWAKLLPALHKTAPQVQFNNALVTTQLPFEELRDGRLQLAVAGFFGELPAGVKRQKLFTDRFVSLVRKAHPLVGRELDLKSFLQMSHVVISAKGDPVGAVDRALASRHRARRVVGTISSFHSAGAVVASSDVSITMPESLAKLFAASLPVRYFVPPVQLPPIQVVQVWHERFDRDPMLRWVRSELTQMCEAT